MTLAGPKNHRAGSAGASRPSSTTSPGYVKRIYPKLGVDSRVALIRTLLS